MIIDIEIILFIEMSGLTMEIECGGRLVLIFMCIAIIGLLLIGIFIDFGSIHHDFKFLTV